jgi:DNA-binding transcriptional ArsR family regulator
MSRLLPFKTQVEPDEGEPRVLSIDDDAADDVFSALSSQTARDILAALYEDPRTASDLAEAADTSLQNARYHLDNLQESGLVEVVDTWYSSRGTEMKVYAPSDASVVMFAGDDSTGPTLRQALGRLVGGVGVLSLASLFVQRVFSPSVPTAGGGDGGAAATTTTTTTTEGVSALGEGGGGEETTTMTETATDAATETTTTAEPATTAPETTEEAATTVQQTATTTQETATTQLTTTAPETTEEVSVQLTQTTTNVTDTALDGGNVTLTNGTETAIEYAAQNTTTVAETTRDAASPGVEAALTSPGVAFFLGGLFVLVLSVAWWYWRS